MYVSKKKLKAVLSELAFSLSEYKLISYCITAALGVDGE